MKVAITQSNYLPWIGYFGMIQKVDLFLLLDVVQFTRRDWRNRNRIKTSKGLSWITVPVETKGMYYSKIDEVKIKDSSFYKNHLEAIRHNYRKATYWNDIFPCLSDLLSKASSFPNLSEINIFLIKKISKYLGIDTPIFSCTDILPRDLLISMDKNSRLLNLCMEVGASEYISGPAAKDYLDKEIFYSNNIEVSWMDYDYLRSYPQLWGDFNPNVSIVDVLFNNGPNSTDLVRA